MKKISKNIIIALVSLLALHGRVAYAYRDTISPRELYGDSNMTSKGAALLFVLVVLINGSFFLMMWLKKKRIEKENLQNLRKLTGNPSTPDSLRNLKDTSELYLRMKNMYSTFSKLEAEKKEKEINEKGEYVGFILANCDMWRHSSGYTVFELKK